MFMLEDCSRPAGDRDNLSYTSTSSKPRPRAIHSSVPSTGESASHKGARSMIARADRDAIVIGVIFACPLEQPAKSHHRRRRLMFELVDPAGKGVVHLLSVMRVDKGREGKRLFPEKIDHVFQIIDALLTGHLMLRERIFLIIELALEILTHEGRGKFLFAHRDSEVRNNPAPARFRSLPPSHPAGPSRFRATSRQHPGARWSRRPA
jgi:hypothetical protein